jgi:hypothetical protein
LNVKNVFSVALLALTMLLALPASAQSQTATAPVPAVALPALTLPTLARHARFELRDTLPGLLLVSQSKLQPRPEDTSPSGCQCIYGPPGSGVSVCGCWCNAGIACVPGNDSVCNGCGYIHK